MRLELSSFHGGILLVPYFNEIIKKNVSQTTFPSTVSRVKNVGVLQTSNEALQQQCPSRGSECVFLVQQRRTQESQANRL